MRTLATTTAFAAFLAGCTGGERRPALPTVPQVYVVDNEDGTISVLDPMLQARAALIQLTVEHGGQYDPYTPFGIAVSPRDGTIWVAAPPGVVYSRTRIGVDAGAATPFEDWQTRVADQLVVVDPATHDVSRRINIQDAAYVHFLAFDRAGDYVYATEYDLHDVVQVDARTYRIASHIDLGEGRRPLGIAACGGRVYVANEGSDSLSTIDPATSNVTETQLPSAPWFVTCTPDARYLFVTLFVPHQVLRIERATGATTTIQLPPESQGPADLLVSPNGQTLLVCDHGHERLRPDSNLVFDIDVENAVVRGSIVVGRGAHSVAFSRDGATAYVTNRFERSISIVDVARRQVTGTIATGRRPTGVVVWNPP